MGLRAGLVSIVQEVAWAPGPVWCTLYRRLHGLQGQSGAHCTGGCMGPRAGLVPIVQEAAWAPGPVWCPLYRRLHGSQGRSCVHCTGGCMGPRASLDECENFAPPVYDLRTIQPVASRYTDCAIPAHG
jgi:hypothetical protein